jgi:hypothetical protein
MANLVRSVLAVALVLVVLSSAVVGWNLFGSYGPDGLCEVRGGMVVDGRCIPPCGFFHQLAPHSDMCVSGTLGGPVGRSIAP